RQHSEFVKDFDYTGLQRHLKVLGIFARLSLRDGKREYLKDIPLVKEYILEVINKYDELLPLVNLITK
ncbi:MAG: aminoglycoside phosphotransferase, partial [Microgenomates group bacterium]